MILYYILCGSKKDIYTPLLPQTDFLPNVIATTITITITTITIIKTTRTMRFALFTTVAFLGLTTTATIVPRRGETSKRNTNVCPGADYPRCCETNDDGVVVACIYRT